MAELPDPVDPLLPARLRALDFVVEGEQLVAESWWRILTAWLDDVRARVLASFRRDGQAPDAQPLREEQAAWNQAIEDQFIPVVASRMQYPYDAFLPEDEESGFGDDPFVRDYLQDVTARMVRLPIEVYADITRIITAGLDAGSSVPDIAEVVRERLTASGSEYWPNRATVVARTETIGATNAGAHAAALRRAEIEGVEAEKVWLATADDRTRPTHQVADGQRVPLQSPFTVGGVPLRFPGDPMANAPQETIQCRCTTLDVVAGETLDWTRRGFVDGEN
jgi:hypothetical protein